MTVATYVSSLFDVKSQLVFYGAYHANPTNVNIHVIFVPLIVWSAQAMFATPILVPSLSYEFNEWMRFDLSFFTLCTILSLLYYFTLEPMAALLYLPQGITSLLTALSFAYRPHGKAIAFGVHIVSWLAQFAGHKFAEGRQPALIDNVLGAFVLAPFFVHLENLFALGYNKPLHDEIDAGAQKKRAELEKAKTE